MMCLTLCLLFLSSVCGNWIDNKLLRKGGEVCVRWNRVTGILFSVTFFMVSFPFLIATTRPCRLLLG